MTLDRMMPSERAAIEAQLAAELGGIEPNRLGTSTKVGPNAQPGPTSDSEMAQYPVNELYQLAYQRVEDELDVLRNEMRHLRQKHKAVEAALERRILKKEALRRKIIASATGNPI